MRYFIELYGLLPQDGDPDTPTYPVGLRGKEIECKDVEEAVSLGIEWGKEILPPLGETLTEIDIMEHSSPGKYRHFVYSLETGKLKEKR
jgi:hypothetical protein